MKNFRFLTLWCTILFLAATFLVNEPFAGAAEGQQRITLRDAARYLKKLYRRFDSWPHITLAKGGWEEG